MLEFYDQHADEAQQEGGVVVRLSGRLHDGVLLYDPAEALSVGRAHEVQVVDAHFDSWNEISISAFSVCVMAIAPDTTFSSSRVSRTDPIFFSTAWR